MLIITIRAIHVHLQKAGASSTSVLHDLSIPAGYQLLKLLASTPSWLIEARYTSSTLQNLRNLENDYSLTRLSQLIQIFTVNPVFVTGHILRAAQP